MNDLEKLRVMLPHWIEHNSGHGEEFAGWAEKLSESDGEIAGLLARAVTSLQEAQSALEQALEKAGGAMEGHESGHHHHH
ncbi:MAG: hypothetical protein GQ559_08455 [Desulfobulbaceae bacterium]|nr:hypothetical protein [Desulfobulbaceae bacterium]